MRRLTLVEQIRRHGASDHSADVDMLALWRVIDTALSPREAGILHRLYDAAGDPTETMSVVAESYGVTQSRIAQIRDMAVCKLRRPKLKESYLRQ